ISGASASTVSTLIQLALIVAITNLSLLLRIWPVLGSGAMAAALYSYWQARQVTNVTTQTFKPERALRWQPAVGFVFLVAAATLLSEALHRMFGDRGAVLGAMTTGLVDTHAAASAISTLVADGKASQNIGVLGVMAALSTNTLTKAG